MTNVLMTIEKINNLNNSINSLTSSITPDNIEVIKPLIIKLLKDQQVAIATLKY